jgi:hypothetical protein
MGLAISVLYFVTYYLTPETIFGPLAAFRIELILAALVFFVSLPAVGRSAILKTPQSSALIGLAFATFLSVLFGVHWFGGGVSAILLFIPNAFAYFLVCIHFTSKKRLQVLVLMLLTVCLFVIAQGTMELQRGMQASDAAIEGEVQDADVYPYQLTMRNSAGEWFYRLRGLGEINDPNDFAQLIVAVLPLAFISWKPKRSFNNFALVWVPVGLLLFGAFLTHSRGAILAMLAMAVVAGRRRFGLIPSIVVAIVLFGAASALHFTGGRDISVDSGTDRLDLWSAGLELFKTHPLFGVGLNRMPEFAGLTAHNSVVVCAAELGFFGLFFWSLFLLPTVRDAITLASPEKVTAGTPIVPAKKSPFPSINNGPIEEIDKEEVNRIGRLLVLSFTGFLVAAWFLSRAFVLTLFLMGGMVETLYEMALQRGMVVPRMPTGRLLRNTALFTVGLLILTYVVLRVGNVMR